MFSRIHPYTSPLFVGDHLKRDVCFHLAVRKPNKSSSFFSKNNFPWINPIFLFQSFSMTSHMFNPFNPRQNPIICFGIILCHLRPYLASELPIFYIFSRIWQISLPYPPHFFHHFPTFSHGFAAVPSTSKARSSAAVFACKAPKTKAWSGQGVESAWGDGVFSLDWF